MVYAVVEENFEEVGEFEEGFFGDQNTGVVTALELFKRATLGLQGSAMTVIMGILLLGHTFKKCTL